MDGELRSLSQELSEPRRPSLRIGSADEETCLRPGIGLEYVRLVGLLRFREFIHEQPPPQIAVRSDIGLSQRPQPLLARASDRAHETAPGGDLPRVCCGWFLLRSAADPCSSGGARLLLAHVGRRGRNRSSRCGNQESSPLSCPIPANPRSRLAGLQSRAAPDALSDPSSAE